MSYQLPESKNQTEATPLIGVKAKHDLSFTISETKKEPFLGYILVGKGEKGVLNNNKQIKCGDITPFLICQKDYKVHGRIFRCKRKTCPNCGDKWVLATAVKLTNDLWILYQKLKGVKWTYNGKTYTGFRLGHITVSLHPSKTNQYFDPITGEFNQDLYRNNGLEYLTSKFAMDEVTLIPLSKLDPFHQEFLIFYRNSNLIFGGVVVFHPYRPNEKYYRERKVEREEEDESPEKELKKWEWIKSKPNWKDYVEFSPHLHYIGLYPWLLPPEEGEDWIYKLISDPKGIKSKEDLFRVIYYLLTHTGVRKEHERAYIRVGLLAPTKFNRNWLFKDVRRYFEQYGLNSQDLIKTKFIELKKLIEKDKDLKDWDKGVLLTALSQYRYFSKRLKKKEAYKCKLCGSPLTGLLAGLRAYFRALLRMRFGDPLKVYDVKTLKFFVLKRDDTTPFEFKQNLLEALDILSGYKPPPDKIPLVE